MVTEKIAQEYVEGQLIIIPKNDNQEVVKLQRNINAKILDSTPHIGAQLWELDSEMTTEEAIALLEAKGDVIVSENYIVTVNSLLPNDSQFNQLWGLNNTGQTGGNANADIDAPEAWEITTGSNNVIVGVMDTGIDYTHPDLAANMWTNKGEIPNNGKDDDKNGYIDDYYGYDFYNGDGDPFDDNSNGHGTRIAGIIGAVGNNQTGVTGVNWNVDLMAIKIAGADGTGYTFNIIQALEYATMMGVKITNNSWGTSSDVVGLEKAIELAGKAGMLFVASAGNEAKNIDLQPHYPASYDEDNIITVAATNHQDQFASWFSNYGTKSVDLAAPGVGILTTIPGNQYASQSGTSLAAPYVAGAAALLWSVNPNLTVNQVKSYLLEGVDQLSSLNGKVLTKGRLNINNSLSLINNQPLPDISISDSTPKIVLESNNNKNLTFTVSLSAASEKKVTVKYDTLSITATEGKDYVKKSGTLSFSPGQTSKTITISIINDNLNEVDEVFGVNLSNSTNANIVDNIGLATITDTLKASVNTTLPSGVENLTLTGNQNIKGVGNEGNNIITGNKANNELTGLWEQDTLTGGNGADILVGAAGNDVLFGGKGNDQFVFNSPTEGVDIIQDFGLGTDKILISANGFGSGLTLGTLPKHRFTIGTVAKDQSDRFIYNLSDGSLFFDPDGTGNLNQVKLAQLSNLPDLNASDFTIF